MEGGTERRKQLIDSLLLFSQGNSSSIDINSQGSIALHLKPPIYVPDKCCLVALPLIPSVLLKQAKILAMQKHPGTKDRGGFASLSDI